MERNTLETHKRRFEAFLGFDVFPVSNQFRYNSIQQKKKDIKNSCYKIIYSINGHIQIN